MTSNPFHLTPFSPGYSFSQPQHQDHSNSLTKFIKYFLSTLVKVIRLKPELGNSSFDPSFRTFVHSF